MKKRIVIPGLPVAQPRQRQRRLPNGGTMNYTPTRHPVNTFKAACQDQWLAAVGESSPPLEGPIHLDILFVMPRPAAMKWKTKSMPRAWHVTTPDDDNMEKAVRDALNRVAWVDDRQICSKRVQKVIASGDEMARTVLRVVAISESVPDSRFLLED